jgi:hypothetical protein
VLRSIILKFIKTAATSHSIIFEGLIFKRIITLLSWIKLKIFCIVIIYRNKLNFKRKLYSQGILCMDREWKTFCMTFWSNGVTNTTHSQSLQACKSLFLIKRLVTNLMQLRPSILYSTRIIHVYYNSWFLIIKKLHRQQHRVIIILDERRATIGCIHYPHASTSLACYCFTCLHAHSRVRQSKVTSLIPSPKIIKKKNQFWHRNLILNFL